LFCRNETGNEIISELAVKLTAKSTSRELMIIGLAAIIPTKSS
jgi:hypothetical protein